MQGLETDGGKVVGEANKSKVEVANNDSMVKEMVEKSHLAEDRATFFDPLLLEADPVDERGVLGSSGFGPREIGPDVVDPLLLCEWAGCYVRMLLGRKWKQALFLR